MTILNLTVRIEPDVYNTIMQEDRKLLYRFRVQVDLADPPKKAIFEYVIPADHFEDVFSQLLNMAEDHIRDLIDAEKRKETRVVGSPESPPFGRRPLTLK